MPKWINLSYANVATTSKSAKITESRWAEKIANGGAAEFDGNDERDALLPLRNSSAKLLNCSVDNMCAGSSATEILSSLAWAIFPKSGSNIVSTKTSFPSTVYPWARVANQNGAEIRLAKHNDELYTKFNDIIELIDENTSVVTISHVEYSNGQRYNLKKLAEATHSVGALLIIDATQSMGLIPLDTQKINADAIVSAGYKWLRGNFGAAVGYISSNILNDYTPGLVGFRSNSDIWDLDPSRLKFPKSANKFEFSTVHFGASIGLSRAIDELNSIGMDKIWSHSMTLTDKLKEGLDNLNLKIISPMNEKERSGIVSIKLPPNTSSDEISHILQKEYSIIVSSRSGFIRISPHIDNTISDVNQLIIALSEII
mgnify:CR=1 FL=1